MPDKIDAAINAAAHPEPTPYHTVAVKIASTQRDVQLAFPVDMTEGEVAEFMGWCGTVLLATVRAQYAKTHPASGLVAVHGSIPR